MERWRAAVELLAGEEQSPEALRAGVQARNRLLQFGARAGQRIRGEHLRLLLGLLILAVGVRFAIELGIRPDDLYTVRETTGGV